MLLIAVLGLLVKAVAGGDPCWFIGFRFAKCRSECVDGMCTNIHQSEIQGGKIFRSVVGGPATLPNIPCKHAAMLASRESTETAVPGSLEETLSEVRNRVLPAVRRMIYSKLHLGTESLEVMFKLDQTLLQHLWSGNDQSTVLRDSLVLSELAVLWNKVVVWSHYVPYSVDTSHGLTAPFIHFGMDIISFLGPEAGQLFRLDSFAMTVATLSAASYPVTYRPAHELELTLRLGADLRENAMTSVDIAFAMQQLVQNPANRRAASLVAQMIPSLQGNLDNAAEALLHQQLVSDICPNLVGILSRSVPLLQFLKTAVSLIYICKPFAGERGALDASINLLASPGNSIQETDVNILVAGLVDYEFPWINGFSSDHQGIPLITLVKRFIDVYEPFAIDGDAARHKIRSEFQSGDVFERTMVGLGRVIALCIRYRLSCNREPGLGFLMVSSFDDPWVDGIIQDNTAQRFPDESRERVQEIFQTNIREPRFYIAQGIRDVIGPAGIYALPMQFR